MTYCYNNGQIEGILLGCRAWRVISDLYRQRVRGDCFIIQGCRGGADFRPICRVNSKPGGVPRHYSVGEAAEGITEILVAAEQAGQRCGWKRGKEMMISDVKKCLLKNISITKAKDIIADKTAMFENTWDLFITDFRSDMYTRNSWYII